MPDAAVVIDGPDWWGDPSVTPDGLPVRLNDRAQRSARRDAAAAEREILGLVVADLPAGCLVLHTAGRGVGAILSGFVSLRDLPVAAWPVPPVEGGARFRNRALAAAAAGLAQHGWLVKAVIFQPDGPGAWEQNELDDLLRSASVFVRTVRPSDLEALRPPPPEDPELDPDPASDVVV